MSKRVCRLLLVCLATSTLWAASDPFVGTWTLNPAKSKVTDRMKVAVVGTNKYTFTFNTSDTETIVADGTDQPGNGGTTLAVTILGPDSWKVIRKRNGTLLLTAIWRLSADGGTLTDSYTAMRPDGSSSTTDYRYTRATAGSGFPAMWESTTTASAFELQIQAYQDDGLTFTYPAQKRTRSMKFDGKDYPDTGPNMPGGAATSGRRVSEGTLNLTSKIDGKIMGTQEMTVSPDRKTLTVTARPPGGGMPNVYVFDRE